MPQAIKVESQAEQPGLADLQEQALRPGARNGGHRAAAG